jgi:hypothetical protein
MKIEINFPDYHSNSIDKSENEFKAHFLAISDDGTERDRQSFSGADRWQMYADMTSYIRDYFGFD